MAARINERGLRRIASILRAWHRRGHEIARSRERLLAWAEGPEEDMALGHTPTIEIKDHDCIRGYTMTFALGREHFDTDTRGE